MKMGFRYVAPFEPSAKTAMNRIDYHDNNFPDHAGWKEIIAVASHGIEIRTSSVPAKDRSLELSNYPTDLLHSPPQVLDAELTFKPIFSSILSRTSSDARAAQSAQNGGARAAARGLLASANNQRPAIALQVNRQKTPRNAFTELIDTRRADFPFFIMAALVAAALGGLHALEPGHGKTLVAAYLVGSRSSARHALLLGGVVTASHTISVYILGLMTLYASRWIVPEHLYPWIGLASGLLVATLGFLLLIKRFKFATMHGYSHHHDIHAHEHDGAHRHTWWGGHVRSDYAAHIHEHIEGDDHLDHDAQTHERAHEHSHSHGQHEAPNARGHGAIREHHEYGARHDHEHDAGSDPVMPSYRSLLAIGVTGGIVPCPAALVVLLAALAIQRVAFGLFLIVAFSVGLAAVLISCGLAVVYARRCMTQFKMQGGLAQRWLPIASSAIITAVGLMLALRSLVTAGVLRRVL
jgi:nickel/cobalt exporter